MHSPSVQSPPPLEIVYHPRLNSVPIKVKVTELCLTLQPHGLYSPWNSPGQNTGVGNRSLLQSLPNPGIGLGSPALQVASLPTEPQGKPKSTGAGSLSLLQRIFLTQESNWGLLHYRWILYQLRSQGSPNKDTTSCKVKVAQSCLTLCDPIDYTVHGILQARILE